MARGFSYPESEFKMASKKGPADAAIKAALVTGKEDLPKDGLHAKRIALVEAKLVETAKYLRDIIDDGPAKDVVFEHLQTVQRLCAKAITKPDVCPFEATAVACGTQAVVGNKAAATEPPAGSGSENKAVQEHPSAAPQS